MHHLLRIRSVSCDAGSVRLSAVQPARGERRHEDQADEGRGNETAENHGSHGTFDFVSGLM